MSGIIHYIDTSVADQSQARVMSLTNRAPQSFPVLEYGDVRSHDFIFHYAGTVEPFSGNANYSLRATLGNANFGPTNGTYILTCGTPTPALDSQSDAAGIQYALNQLAAISAVGGVTVVGTFPTFLIGWNAVGVFATALTANATLLLPTTTITIATIQAGDSTHAQVLSLSLRQAVVSQQTNWATSNSPSNGWVGTLSTNTANTFPFIDAQTVPQGQFVQAQTLLTVEVLDTSNSNNPTAYYQTPVLIRLKNLGL